MKEKIKKQLKDREDLPFQDFQIVEKKEGESNHNFILESGKEKFVLRVSKEISREDRLGNEAEKLEFLQTQDIEFVPRKIRFDKDTSIGTFLLESYVGKKDLHAGNLNSERLRDLASKIADIHSIPIENYSEFSGKIIDEKISLKKIFERDFRKWSKRPYMEYRKAADSVNSEVEKFFQMQKDLLDHIPNTEVQQALIHGDLGFNIRAEGSRVFIVDWEFSRIDYPGNEILYCFEHEGLDQKQREIFLNQYRKHRDLGEVFDEIREIYPGFLAFNDLVWAAKRYEIEPERRQKHQERMENKIEKLKKFYRERNET